MWCVAELNEDYIAKMEMFWRTYEQPYNPQQPVVCLVEPQPLGEQPAKLFHSALLTSSDTIH
jgi:hypothetical protein